MINIDKLIFHSKKYQDIKYCKKLKLTNIHYIPNGACDDEFNLKPTKSFDRDQINVLANGSNIPSKGNLDLIYFFLTNSFKKKISLTINTSNISSNNFKLKNPKKYLIFLKKLPNVFQYDFLYFLIFNTKLINILILLLNFSSKKKIEIVNLDRHALIKKYYDADIFITLSHLEYSPLVIFESMASGTPFLASDVGNIKEIINYSNSGILLKTHIKNFNHKRVNFHDLKIKFNKFIKNKKKLKLLSLNGRKSFVQNYNWKIISQKYFDIFNETLKND